MLVTLPPALHLDPSLTPEDLSHWEAVRGVKMSDPHLIYATFHEPASPGASDVSLDVSDVPPLAPSASLSGVELGELLGITDADVSDVLVQLDQTDADESVSECEAAFSHALGADPAPLRCTGRDAVADAAAGNLKIFPPASSSLDELRLEVSFEPHSTEGGEKLVIKGRKLDVLVRLVDAAGRPAARDAARQLQLGITLIYEHGAEVEGLLHAGTEPLLDVLGVQQPWTDESGAAKFDVKLNVLSSMRRNTLFRLCVFPADVALCKARPELCATSVAFKTLCKKPKAAPVPTGEAAAESSRTTGMSVKTTQCKKPKASPVSSPGAAAPALAAATQQWTPAPAPAAVPATEGTEPVGAPQSAAVSGCSAPGLSRLDSEADRLAARVHAQVSQIESLSASNSELLEELARLRAQLSAAVTLPLRSPPPSARMPLRRKRCA